MKKTLMFVMAAIMMMSCASKKAAESAPAAPQKSANELEIERLKQEKEIRALRAEIVEDSIKRAQKAQVDQMAFDKIIAAGKTQPVLEGQLLLIPCLEEVLQLENEHQMAAQGISTGKATQEAAMLDANRVGIADITTRFAGVIKNGVEQYTKDTQGKSGNRGQESQLEGLAIAAGEKAINELFKVGCKQFIKDNKGNYACYEALYIPTKEVMDRVIDAVEEAEVDVDKALFRNRLNAELDRQAAQQEAANQQKLEQLKAAKDAQQGI